MTSHVRLLNRRTLLGAVATTVLASTTIGPLDAAARQATPAGATPAARPGSGGIASMLAAAPASYPWVGDAASMMINYADVATELDVTGVEPIDSVDDPNMRQWILATHMLAMPRHAVESLDTWRADYGFDVLQADETLEVSLSPFNLSLFRGRFDPDGVRAALTNSGYQAIGVDGSTIYSLRDDNEQDATSPLASAQAAMTHGAILDDGTLVFSSVRAAVEAVFAVADGAAPSLLSQSGVALLAEHAPADLVSATIADGAVLTGYTPIPGVTEAPAGEIAPVTVVLAGVTAGGVIPGGNGGLPPDTPVARAIAMAVMQTPEAAEAAVPVIEERLATGASAQTGQPWSQYFAGSTISAVPDAPVLVIDLTVSDGVAPTILAQGLETHDLGLLAW